MHHQGLRGDVTALFESKKPYRSVEIIGPPGPLEGNAVLQVFPPLRIFIHYFVLLGAKPSRRQAIDGDAVAAPVGGEAHRQLADSAAAGAIRSQARVAGDAGD